MGKPGGFRRRATGLPHECQAITFAATPLSFPICFAPALKPVTGMNPPVAKRSIPAALVLHWVSTSAITFTMFAAVLLVWLGR